jgi:hypothetical protein
MWVCSISNCSFRHTMCYFPGDSLSAEWGAWLCAMMLFIEGCGMGVGAASESGERDEL